MSDQVHNTFIDDLELTAKQMEFIDAYDECGNLEVARRKCGYKSPLDAIMQSDKVKRALMRRRKARIEQANIDAAWILHELAEMASADVRQIFDENNQLLPVVEWPDAIVKRITKIDIKDTPHGKDTSIGLTNPLQIVKELGNLASIQAFRETIEHKHSMLEDLVCALDDDVEDAILVEDEPHDEN